MHWFYQQFINNLSTNYQQLINNLSTNYQQLINSLSPFRRILKIYQQSSKLEKKFFPRWYDSHYAPAGCVWRRFQSRLTCETARWRALCRAFQSIDSGRRHTDDVSRAYGHLKFRCRRQNGKLLFLFSSFLLHFPFLATPARRVFLLYIHEYPYIS